MGSFSLAVESEKINKHWAEQEGARLLAMAGAAADDVDRWCEVLGEHSRYSAHASSQKSKIDVRFRLDSTDEDARQDLEMLLSEVIPIVSTVTGGIYSLLAQSEARDEIGKRYSRMMIANAERYRRNREIEVAELLSLSEKIAMGYTEIVGDATITLDGEQKPLSAAAVARASNDSEVRRAGFEAMVECYRGMAEELEDVFDEARDVRHRTAAALGDESYVESSYRRRLRTDFDQRDVKEFRHSVEKHLVPVVKMIREEQAQEIYGARAQLIHPADVMQYGRWSPKRIVPVEEQASAASKVFHSVHPDLGRMFDETVDDDRLDLAVRKGKAPGAFCATFLEDQLPFVVCNSSGVPSDARTLIHEFGHAFQKYRTFENGCPHVDLVTASSDIGEIHSMALELLVAPYMNEFFPDGDAHLYLARTLRSGICNVPYMCAVDEFQHHLYPPLSSPEFPGPDRIARAALFAELLERYQPGVDHSVDEWWMGHVWLAQRHITLWPFYYIDYAVAQMMAWQLWLRSIDDHTAALSAYLKLLDMGGRIGLVEAGEILGARSPFEEQTVKDVAQALAEHL